MSAGYLRKCAGKRRYPDRASAEEQRKSMAVAGKWTMSTSSTYRCNQCLSWHTGHSRGKFRGKGKR